MCHFICAFLKNCREKRGDIWQEQQRKKGIKTFWWREMWGDRTPGPCVKWILARPSEVLLSQLITVFTSEEEDTECWVLWIYSISPQSRAWHLHLDQGLFKCLQLLLQLWSLPPGEDDRQDPMVEGIPRAKEKERRPQRLRFNPDLCPRF